ncbi:MAG: hypothetical protein M1821_007354 [Bathelium mastoideum]|nr:MAG: hypothetical protein M1821_007354 [Bathelium mastoideum]
MSISDYLKGLPILKGAENYAIWKGPISMYLKSQGLWGYVKEAPTPDQKQKSDFDQKDAQAALAIYMCVSNELKPMLDSRGTAHELWTKLKNAYTLSGPALKESKWRLWVNMKYDGNADIEVFCRNFTKAFEDARNAGLKALEGKDGDELAVYQFLYAIEGKSELFTAINHQKLRDNRTVTFEQFK